MAPKSRSSAGFEETSMSGGIPAVGSRRALLTKPSKPPARKGPSRAADPPKDSREVQRLPYRESQTPAAVAPRRREAALPNRIKDYIHVQKNPCRIACGDADG